MKIVVTGGAGFIGSRLVRKLSQLGHEVTAWDLRPLGSEEMASSVIVDVRNLSEVEKELAEVEAVYHLAGPVVESSRKNPYESCMLQHSGTLAVLEACHRRNVPKVLLASSFYVYDRIDEKMIVNEETPLDLFQMELLGVAKLAAERVVKDFAAKYGMEYVIFRFGSAYGYGDCSNVVKTFLEMGFRGETIEIWGKGLRRNQYTYVDDIIDGCVLALTEKNETYNLISPEETSTSKLAQMIRESYGFDIVFNEVAKEGPSMSYMSSMKAIKRLGWKPMGLADGITKMVAEMKPDLPKT